MNPINEEIDHSLGNLALLLRFPSHLETQPAPPRASSVPSTAWGPERSNSGTGLPVYKESRSLCSKSCCLGPASASGQRLGRIHRE